tara:strand:+ start:102 stop:380 length:279 start_codon:yes stop_codon:yes gene_type:complete
MYTIKPRQKRAAKRIGFSIKPSTDSKKKVDVYLGDKKISSIGAIEYSDYATYIKTNGLEYANKRKSAYLARHEKTRKVVGSKSYYAAKILWS